MQDNLIVREQRSLVVWDQVDKLDCKETQGNLGKNENVLYNDCGCSFISLHNISKLT